MTLYEAVNLFQSCDEDCDNCPLYDMDIEVWNVCDCFKEAAEILERHKWDELLN